MEDIQSTQLPEEQQTPVSETANAEATAAAASEPQSNAEQPKQESEAAQEGAPKESKGEEKQQEYVPMDFTPMTDEQLAEYVGTLMQENSTRLVHKQMNDAKNEFRARVAKLVEKEKQEFEANQSSDEEQKAEFEHQQTDFEKLMEERFRIYDAARAKEREEIRKQQELNAEQKQALIDELRPMVEQNETNPSSLLKKVKDIIAKWKEVGPVPSDKHDLNKTFHALTEEYFKKLNIDRELRNLDMKKNEEAKIKLCEEAEALKDEPNASRAFFKIQQLHASWKSIGSVPSEVRESLWERFREATAVINKRFHQQAENEREREKVNYAEKSKLCEEAQAVADSPMTTAKEAEEAATKIQDIQQRWRKIGYAPKEVNEEIYAKFRSICDKVFDTRRAFFKEQNATQSANLKLKEALCEKAEAVKDSTDWKKTASYLIDLQKQWKEIGPVPRKVGEAIWKRFRAACDEFFENRQKQSDGDTAEMQANLEKKKALLEEMKAFQPVANNKDDLRKLKDFMKRWNAIGYVPMDSKKDINKEYAEIVDKHFDALNLNSNEGQMERFRSRMEVLGSDKQGRDRLIKERNQLVAQAKQLETDIATLETNVTFLAKSKNSDGIIAEVNKKVARARVDIEEINKKIAVLDDIIG